MKIFPLLADAGRPGTPGNVSLLNAGWTYTTAVVTPDGGLTLPSQALAVFFEGSWDELNRPHHAHIELVDDEERRAQFNGADGPQDAVIEHRDLLIPSVPGAPNGTPGTVVTVFEMEAGFLRIPAPRRRYIWRARVGATRGEVGFWVHPPAHHAGVRFGAAADD